MGVMELKNIRLYRFLGVGEIIVEGGEQAIDYHLNLKGNPQITLNVSA